MITTDRRRYKMRDLPVGYERLEYVYNDSSKGKPNFPLTFSLHDLILDFKYQNDNENTNRGFFITRTDVSNTAKIANTFRWVLYVIQSSKIFAINWYNKNASQAQIDFPLDDAVHTWHYDFGESSQSVTMDNETNSSSQNQEETQYTYHLYHSSRNYYSSGWLYYLKISKHDGTVLYDLVPCKRKRDGVVGLYDRAGKSFWYNPSAPLFEEKPTT